MAGCAAVRQGPTAAVLGELAPTGKLRVIGIANTTIRNTGRLLKNTGITATPSVAQAMEMLRTGQGRQARLWRRWP